MLCGPSEAWLSTAGSHRMTPVVHGALQTCLHVPAGLVVSAAEPQAAQQSEADEALVAQQAADVAQLQAEIAAVGFLDERAGVLCPLWRCAIMRPHVPRACLARR